MLVQDREGPNLWNCSRVLRSSVLLLLFFVICLGLGYPTLNRYDPALQNPDAGEYRQFTIHGSASVSRHFQHRVLIPALARPIYELAVNRVGTWDAGYLALLTINSAFVSATSFLLLLITLKISGSENIALLAAALFLLNFAVSNLLLSGYVDAGEAFFLTLIVFDLLNDRWWILPAAVVFGTLTKETFLPFSVVFSLTWALVERSSKAIVLRRLYWIAIGTCAGVAAITAALSITNHSLLTPWGYARTLGDSSELNLGVALGVVKSRMVWYVFGYLIVLGSIRLNELPRSWKAACVLTVGVALGLAVYHNALLDAGPAFARPAFSIAGPLLTCSMALFLARRENGVRSERSA